METQWNHIGSYDNKAVYQRQDEIALEINFDYLIPVDNKKKEEVLNHLKKENTIELMVK